MTPVVLVHGGGFAASCWDLMLDHFDGPALAVDLPGRGVHPAPLDSVTIAGAADSVVRYVDAAGFDEIILVGHSLAGGSMPSVIRLLGERVRHAVFVARTVPAHGQSCFDAIAPDMQERVMEGQESDGRGVLGADLARTLFGNDLDDEQFAWCLDQRV